VEAPTTADPPGRIGGGLLGGFGLPCRILNPHDDCLSVPNADHADGSLGWQGAAPVWHQTRLIRRPRRPAQMKSP